ncbi:MAG: DegT/DnrJ/EryC1/StrS family aminotransferase [Nanoarchaeota archaeon]|nr:DegT/DnrJ/EryC1/StrS family aminotransferase [Nanoarchaeota archaeon]
MIPVFRPSYSEKEVEAVRETLKSGWWGAGPKAAEFEKRFADFIGTKHAVSLNSCTAAFHLLSDILKLPKGSEVITTPLTFVSSAYIASYAGLKLVFADVEEDTLNIDPDDVKKKLTSKSKLLMPVHYGGHACRMDELKEISDKHDLVLIEDAAHATGGKYKGKMLGSLGDAAGFSFQAVKNLATGDGGMLTTDNAEWAERAKVLRWVGINKDTSERTGRDQYSWEYRITDIGYKFQMCDIIAAIGLVQLDRLEEMNGKRRQITECYNEAFSNLSWLDTPVMKDYADHANHNYVIKVRKDRERFISELKKQGISTGVHYLPLYMHPVFKGTKAKCPIADRVWKQLVTLPLYPDMTEEEMNKVIGAVKSFS